MAKQASESNEGAGKPKSTRKRTTRKTTTAKAATAKAATTKAAPAKTTTTAAASKTITTRKKATKAAASALQSPQRFVLSHRCSGQTTDDLKASREQFEEALSKQFKTGFTTIANAQSNTRGLVQLEGERAELLAKRKDLGQHVLIEPLLPRYNNAASLGKLYGVQPDTIPHPVGTGTTFTLTVVNENQQPLANVKATFYFQEDNLGYKSQSAATETSNDQGQIAFEHDPADITIFAVELTPNHGYWTLYIDNPQNGATITIPALPQTGPIGWWHRSVGVNEYQPTAGQGIKIGVVGTGVGPNSYLKNVTGLGAYINGTFTPGAEAAFDISNHGTHVCGILSAQPPQGSGHYGGLVPGAQVAVIRVFNQQEQTNNMDVAAAIDMMANEQVDLINLSLGGGYSAIEADAIQYAMDRGTLSVCAAGNGYGSPVDFPAALRSTIAVSAMGLQGTAPANSIADYYLPKNEKYYGAGGTFFPSFNDRGTQISIMAPGCGIISTVPTQGTSAAYLDMAGTSMATPMAVGTVSRLLAQDQAFNEMPRNLERATYIYRELLSLGVSVGLATNCQGNGLVRADSQ